jgi:hypothetical protein
MYKSPRLERYGTFRELTAGGGSTSVLDGATVFAHDFCVPDPNPADPPGSVVCINTSA